MSRTLSVDQHFESGLIPRLGREWPDRDVEWIAEEIAEGIAEGRIRRPSQALVAAVKRAQRDDTHRRGARPRPPLTRTVPAVPREQPIEHHQHRCDPTYFAFRYGLVLRILGEGLRPHQVADELAAHVTKFDSLPGVVDAVDAEISAYRAMGKTWLEWRPEPVMARLNSGGSGAGDRGPGLPESSPHDPAPEFSW